MRVQAKQRSVQATTSDTTPPRERYTKWGNQASDRYHAIRTAGKHAAFFMPYLQPGMKVLDCGCGPGSITTGLAQVVAPGEVYGVDLDKTALEVARTDAKAKDLSNTHFEYGSVYALPFPDNSFDAVFSHAVLEHLGEPVAMLREMQRVLRPGGVAGVRTPDHDGTLLAPSSPLVEQFLVHLRQWQELNGADHRRGKRLRSLLRQAGFAHIQVAASYESHATPVATQFIASLLISTLLKNKQRWIEAGLADEETIKAMAAAWQHWAVDPDAFIALTWGEAVAWKVQAA